MAIPFNEIVDALVPHMSDADERKSHLNGALYGCKLLEQIEWGGASRIFTTNMLRKLLDFGECEAGKPAIITLLEYLKGQIGGNKAKELTALIAKINAAAGISPTEIDTSALPELANKDLYIFISYARPQQALAEQVEKALQAAGLRVFRDASDIRSGADWDMTIEAALKEADRIVLLLSKDSMPYRKEVHREWFYFDQTRKPIYPLYTEDCELHSRLYSYNYIDARNDLQAALVKLLNDLGKDYTPPQ